MDVQNFFNSQEKERIQKAVDAAEERTAGEIVPMIVGASARYAEVELSGMMAGLIAGIATGLVYWNPWEPTELYLALPAVGGLLGLLLCRIPGMKRLLIPKKRIDAAVLARSLAAFTAHGLHYTKAHTGILILVSLLEHRVEVLADKGINEKVLQGVWDEIVNILTSGLKSGKACDAFCQAIERCGEILAMHFPRSPDDHDELADKLITEK
ncbi:MAG TPA: TPM domain-containing protein [Candidatus Binatia bacterium]|jgi:putative membrane protein|nr:TPM domain-containing protein [Candidatus Binatia bacterium]